ncbi:hypothetical protein A1Q1_04190 [Trichosporon asahii var. asahii CBS 2479]|uniref:Uncharacterized protein n=1 Tax=Trichosporon asahii var. asahii (strain ATCC 90039 / CBS 2479 / JCM 2466 / KCTC 7840 / NBRC 103889/ NCYC 2677 / UAMH 7654) TaxID=1186058 RepID=J4U920_TRIAS|nr:hypothetical protein A1Q1_04190 [Trichosporon asahii var. asahii CBS 2479]EJT47070.1 hypothetical protein A1Q1_04190 [Trichosporon asahii var. asahii CBS 2479]
MHHKEPTTHLYRALLRELRLGSPKKRAERNPLIGQQLRAMVDEAIQRPHPQNIDRAILEARDFLRSARIHAELLQRYNPTLGMSEEERIHATARRVGLDTPIEYKA